MFILPTGKHLNGTVNDNTYPRHAYPGGSGKAR